MPKGNATDDKAAPIADLRRRLDVALAKAVDAARADLRRLRRCHLDTIADRGMLRLDLESGPLRLGGRPLVTVDTVQYPVDWDLQRLEHEVVRAARTWVTASARLSEELLFTVISDGISMRLGFASVAAEESSDQTDSVAARLQAAFPGVSFGPCDAGCMPGAAERLRRFRSVRVMTGIPAVTDADARQLYSLDRLVRGMCGRPFALAVSARRVSADRVHMLLDQVLKDRSENWERIRREISEQVGEEDARTLGISGGVMGGMALAITKALTVGLSGGGLGSLSICAAPGGVGIVTTTGGNAGGNIAGTLSSAVSGFGGGQAGLSHSITRSKSSSLASSHEGLNAFAEAYDALLQDHAERMKGALTEGAWEAVAYIFGGDPQDTKLAAALWAREMTGEVEPVEPFRDYAVDPCGQAVTLLSIPRVDDCSLGTVLTSSELAALINLPTESHPGLEVRRVPRFAVNFPRFDQEEGSVLGEVLDRDVPLPGVDFGLPSSSLASHMLVAGITGSGKTTTVQSLLDQLGDLPFLVIEPAKMEYRRLVNRYPDLQVFTAGDEQVSPFRINPFDLPEDGNLLAHIDALTAIINAAFPMEGPMASLVEQAVMAAYKAKGWDIDSGLHPAVAPGQRTRSAIPSMSDFYNELEETIAAQGYAGDYGANIRAALLTRIRSLCIGPRGRMFNTRQSVSIEALVGRPTVVELRHLGSDETRSFMMGLLLHRVYKFFEHAGCVDGLSDRLRCVLIVEEAHRLFRRAVSRGHGLTGTDTRFQAVELFENIMAEARSLGLGMVIIDQLPLRLSEGAVKNTGTKIIHRLSAVDDATEMGGSMGLSAEESSFITRLRRGQALVHRSDMERPAHVRIPPPRNGESGRFSDADIAAMATVRGYSMRRTTPAAADRLVRRLLKERPNEFVALGDALVLSLFVGRLTAQSLEKLVGQAEDRVFALSRQVGVVATTEVAAAVLVEAGEDVLGAKWYLRGSPTAHDRVLGCWRAAVAPTRAAGRLTFDTDQVLELRSSLHAGAEGATPATPPALAAACWDRVRRFLPEAAGLAQTIASKLASCGGDASGIPARVESAVAERIAAKLLSDGGERAAEYALAAYVEAFELLTPGQLDDASIAMADRHFRLLWSKDS